MSLQPERIDAVEIGEGGALLAVASRLTGNNWDSELLIWTDREAAGTKKGSGRKAPAASVVTSDSCGTVKWLGARAVATGSDCGSIFRWDWKGDGTLQQVAELDEHDDMVRSLDLSADGNVLLSASQDSSVKLWDAQGGTNHSTATVRGHAYGCLSAKFEHGSGQLFGSIGRDGTLRCWDARKTSSTAVHHMEAVPTALLYSGGNSVVTGHIDGSVRFFDKRSMGTALKHASAQANAVTALAASSKGLVAAGSDDGTVVVYDPAAKAENGGKGTAAVVVYTGHGHTDFVRAVVWQDETTLVSGGWDGQLLNHTVSA